MGRYVADTEQILTLVERAKNIGQRIEARITDIEREVTALNVEWEGDAATAHRTTHDTLHREMNDMRTALMHLESTARGAHDRYVANARHNSGMWP
ncbi:WXG100 family type VII secretion target [Rhodococcus sp. IEGM 1379]|uniref:WXG100 family type VII secretion target n=1 Tax=Rhodococcus sp. IEGM 1379 TaxID=3047086 RepID=UPI0024B78822|nr:WXG100 family type VII secretion target [Rhodococcus sp. IEGM 1379]MDI9918791.1 WXG100 family type VII secretion target [Rhodococcus sp. IEGM 1379]